MEARIQTQDLAARARRTTVWRIGGRTIDVGRIDVWFPTLVVLGVLLLSAFGISGSSLPTFSASGAPDEASLIRGKPRPIRSDEWRAWSPMKTGRVQAGFPETQVYGMGEVDLSGSWRPQLPSRSVGAALYSPFNLPIVVLPLTQGFALMWWLPFAACCLGVFAWLRALRVGPALAMAAALFATTAPAAVWWSGWLCQTIGAAAIPCAILVAATRTWARSPRWGAGLAVLGALAAANLPWFYQPWALPSALFMGGVTALWGLGTRAHRRAFLTVAAIAGALFVVEQAVYYLHEREYYDALRDTVYPGERRTSGGDVTIGLAFSSLFAWALGGSKANGLISTNLSEVSMGWTIFAPFTATVAMLARRTLLRDPERVLIVGSLLLATVLTSWSLVAWPTVVGNLSGLALVPGTRMAPLIGFFWMVALALMCATAERRAAIRRDLGRSGAVVVVGATTLTAAWGATRFRTDFLPGLSNARTWMPVVLVAIVVVVLCTRYWAIALGAAVAASVITGVAINPLSIGLGKIDDSRAAALVDRIDARLVARHDGTWAAVDGSVNALLNGRGVDSLSSFNDPVVPSGWRTLDPTGAQEDVWNRFAYIDFAWEPGLEQPVIDSPGTDQVVVRVDPCDPRLTRLRLRAVVSAEPLQAECLTQEATFRWQGQRYTIYARR